MGNCCCRQEHPGIQEDGEQYQGKAEKEEFSLEIIQEKKPKFPESGADEQPRNRKENEEQVRRKRKTKEIQEPVLTEQPWREIKGWSKEVREELKHVVARRRPETYEQLDVPYFNIVLTGQIGAGKSSYFNSINNIFQEEIVGASADVGKTATSLTKEYRVYKVTPKGETEPLRWRICDTMGLESRKEHDWSNILEAVGGHVPDGFEFSDQDMKIKKDTPGYIADPELKDKAHCVALVIDAKGFVAEIDDSIKTKLKSLRNELGAPRTYILLTHIDEAFEEVNRDVTKVYHSTAIRNLVLKVSTMLDGLPENQIFPVMNYKKQVELETAMDILLLYPLRQMLSNAQNVLKNELEKLPRHDTLASPDHRRSFEGEPVAPQTTD